MAYNPFSYGGPVSPTAFIGRRQVLRRIVGRMLHHGQSTAIVGEPHMGKTSLLQYLEAPAKRVDFYGAAADQLLFCSLDTQPLGGGFTAADFWQQALAPVKTQRVDPAPDSDVAKQYQVCQANGFGTFTLEVLFQRLHAAGDRLVLLIDEFDALLHHPVLNSAEFFGGLRALASRSQGALTLVVASRLPLARLNAETQHFNPTGSPYFNIFAEFTLDAFAEQDVNTLLALAGDRFTPDDRRHLQRLAGGHPYLLQAAAAALWEAYEEQIEASDARHRAVFEQLYQENKLHFADTWRVWTPEVRQAFTCVALAEAKMRLQDRTFEINTMLGNLPTWEPELKALEHVGWLKRNPGALGGWQVTQTIMLAWLWDELMRAIRSEDAFGQWLRSTELEGRWTQGQRKQLWGTLAQLRDGSADLLQKLALGVGMGIGSGGA